MGAPFKQNSDVKWVTDKNGNVLGFMNDINAFSKIPKLSADGTALSDGNGNSFSLKGYSKGVGFNPFGQNISSSNITTLTPQSGSIVTLTDVQTTEGSGVRAVSDTVDKYIEMVFALPYPMLIKNLGIIGQFNGISNATIGIYASTDVSFNSNLTISKGLAVNSGGGLNGAQSNGLVSLTLCGQSPSNMWTNAGPLNLDTALMTYIKIRVTPASGQFTDFTVVKWVVNPANKSRVAFTFDDGIMSQFTYAAPLLQAAGLRGSFAIIPSLVGSSAGYMNLAQLRELKANGHEILTHGPVGGAGSLVDNYATVTAMVADAVTARNQLVDWGLITTESEYATYIWPQGKWQQSAGQSTLLDAMKAVGFNTGRSVTRYLGYSHAAARTTQYGGMIVPIIGHLRSSVSAVDEDTIISKCVAAIDYAALTGLDAVSMFHNIIADQGVFAATSSNDIEVSRFVTIRNAVVAQIAAGKATNELFSTF